MSVGALTLLDVVTRLAGARIACVGDVMLDRFVSGTIERISPEAPVPVLRIDETMTMLGGAGNVVRNISALGAGVAFVAVVGDDATAREIERHLTAAVRVGCTLIYDADRATTIKTRYLAAGQQLLRSDYETIRPLSPAVRRQLIDAAQTVLPTVSVLALSDYGKGILLDGVAAELIAAARAANVPVIVDPKGRDFRGYAGATLLTPNRRELAEALGCPVERGEEAAAAVKLRDIAGVTAVLVTLGRDGMLLASDAACTELPTDARDVFDVSGAGDTVVAAIAAALAVGADIETAARLANLAAGIVVGKVGTAVARRDDIVAALHRQELGAAENKILSWDAAAERAAAWRRQGLSVGFTNGCFDLIHPGHVSLLAQAKAACDRLIVGLNDDGSVTRFKGPSRPVQPALARTVVLTALAAVDAVVLFREDTPAALIETLRPDVLVKGADYRLEQIVGADFVRSHGGRVVLAKLEPGYSTSATVSRLAATPET